MQMGLLNVKIGSWGFPVVVVDGLPPTCIMLKDATGAYFLMKNISTGSSESQT